MLLLPEELLDHGQLCNSLGREVDVDPKRFNGGFELLGEKVHTIGSVFAGKSESVVLTVNGDHETTKLFRQPSDSACVLPDHGSTTISAGNQTVRNWNTSLSEGIQSLQSNLFSGAVGNRADAEKAGLGSASLRRNSLNVNAQFIQGGTVHSQVQEDPIVLSVRRVNRDRVRGKSWTNKRLSQPKVSKKRQTHLLAESKKSFL